MCMRESVLERQVRRSRWQIEAMIRYMSSLQKTALPCPKRKKKLVGAVKYRPINSEMEPSVYLHLASVWTQKKAPCNGNMYLSNVDSVDVSSSFSKKIENLTVWEINLKFF